jgi:hypothetical protein
MTPQITQLNAKAMLVKLTMRRANLTRRDKAAEDVAQTVLDDESLVVNSKLFRDKLNPINKVMSAASEIYTHHKKWTLPWADKGPRILPVARYDEYRDGMRKKIDEMDATLKELMPNYDRYVQLDIAFRSKNASLSGRTGRANPEDYPSADEFRTRMGFDLRFMPLPTSSHFLFDVAEDDLKAFEESMVTAANAARNDAVSRMLKPLHHLVEKLNKPIGTDGSIFRDSAIENVVEGLDEAKALTIDPPAELTELMDKLKTDIKGYALAPHQLRESPIVRDEARQKLDYIAKQMSAWMGQ